MHIKNSILNVWKSLEIMCLTVSIDSQFSVMLDIYIDRNCLEKKGVTREMTALLITSKWLINPRILTA